MGREVGLPDDGSTEAERDMGPPMEKDEGLEDWADRDRVMFHGDEKRLVREDSETKAWSIIRDLDPWTAWLYKPHTVTVLLAGACLVV